MGCITTQFKKSPVAAAAALPAAGGVGTAAKPFLIVAASRHSRSKSVMPEAILHVGPGKMATITLQGSLLRDRLLLKRDGYAVLAGEDIPGRVPKGAKDMLAERAGHNVGFCLRHSDCSSSDTWRAFRAFLNRSADQNLSLVISSEVIGGKPPNANHL